MVRKFKTMDGNNAAAHVSYAYTEVAGIHPMAGRDRINFAQPQLIKFINIVQSVKVFHLVHSQQHFFFGAAQHLRNFHIFAGHTGFDIAHKNDYISFFHGHLRLFAHPGQNGILTAHFNTAGINQGKFLVIPLSVLIQTVTGYTRIIFHNGHVGAGQTVK